ncbi:uncharacterized protein LOC123532561 [Mercenaria mercenaria]|uniref:uncharacterized protein LOC123532561 n=1 Tax=Mercenaria mercenaria TaxID=6596 RepID=UPI00234ED858|nr:uncharacterized protein LOC123532561 [Mercenaria mercenaria]
MMKSSSSRGANGDRVKYSAIKSDDSNPNEGFTEKSLLLENMESLNISSPVRNKTTQNVKELTDLHICDDTNKSDKSEADGNNGAKDDVRAKPQTDVKVINTAGDKDVDLRDHQGARPKFPVSQRSTTETSGGSTDTVTDDNIDIVRKMSQPQSENYVPWRNVGPYHTLKQKKCQRLYAATGRIDDLALFFQNGRFYAMEAWCTHMGGPLFEGDIEDYNGKCHVMCPWHSYMFDLETGTNEIGLQVHDLKLEAGQIYVRYHTEVTTESNRKASVPTGPRIINRPPEGKHEKMRKLSVLDTPIKLA